MTPIQVTNADSKDHWMLLLPSGSRASVRKGDGGLFICHVTNGKDRTAGTMCGSVDAGFDWCKDMLGRWDRNEVIA